MSKYKILDGDRLNQVNLNLCLENIENSTSSTTIENSSRFALKRPSISTKLFITSTLAIISKGNAIEKDQVKFKQPAFSEESLKQFNRTIEKPLNDYISELSNLVTHKGHFTKKDVIDKLIAFRSLNENWDGYGALPLQVKSTSNAVQFIYFLNDSIVEKLSDVYPTPNGTVSLVWENEVSERLTLELGSNTLSYYVKFNSQKPIFCNNIEINAKEANTISNFIKAI